MSDEQQPPRRRRRRSRRRPGGRPGGRPDGAPQGAAGEPGAFASGGPGLEVETGLRLYVPPQASGPAPSAPAGAVYCIITVTCVCCCGSSANVTCPLVVISPSPLRPLVFQPMRLLGSNVVISASHSTSLPSGPSICHRLVRLPVRCTDLIFFLSIWVPLLDLARTKHACLS